MQFVKVRIHFAWLTKNREQFLTLLRSEEKLPLLEIDSLVTDVRKYIFNRKEHHHRNSFDDEFEGCLKREPGSRGCSAKAETQGDCSPLAEARGNMENRENMGVRAMRWGRGNEEEQRNE
jgi:hypothetical protein